MTAPPSRVGVAVVGAGPVGATAANLLGLYGVSTLVVDREPDVVDYPRAVGVDDEGLRTFQSIGLADEIARGVIQNVPLKIFGTAGHCLADIRPSAREFGWYKRNIFMQPAAERVLRAGLERFGQVHLMLGTELSRFDQDADGVRLALTGGDGRKFEVRADYVVAADGGRSGIRAGLGIPLEGTTHGRRWVVVDCANDPLDAPYTGLHGDARRPYVCAHLPDDHRRWEFMLFPGEDTEEMLSAERVRDLLRHHVSDPGAVDIIRARVYTHHSRIARRFTAGRVALAGDAAHLMPPWAGQGLNTGLRDVTNLCWKLAAMVQGQAGPSLLDTYDRERRPHAQAMIDLSTRLGRILVPGGPARARARDLVMRAASAAPGVKRWVLEMGFKPVPAYRDGFVAGVDAAGAARPAIGRMIAQPTVETPDGARLRLDDVLGNWFAILGFECDPLAGLTPGELAVTERLRPTVVKVVESRAGQRHHRAACVDERTLVVEDADNELRAWFAQRRHSIAVVRPDRYVAATAARGGLGPVVTELAARLGPVDPP